MSACDPPAALANGDVGAAGWYAGAPRSSSTVTKRYPRLSSASIVMLTAFTVSALTPPRALNPSWKISIAPGRVFDAARRAILAASI
jgi:hypothetical protein